MKRYFLSVLLFAFTFPYGTSAQQHNLDFYLEQAKANSTFIHQNRNEKQLVRLDMEQIRKIYSKPEVTVDASVLFAPIISNDGGSGKFQLVTKDAIDYTGYDLAVTDGGQYQGVVSVNQGIFNGRKIDTYNSKAEIQQQIHDNNIQLTEHELENAVKHQYLLCLKSTRQASNNKELAQEVSNEISIMKELVRNAIYKQSDLKLLEIARQNYEQAYETFQAEYRDNIYNLNLLCGINEGADTEIEPVEFSLNREEISNSRFLTSFYLDSLAIIADRNISELKYQPQVNLFANAGMNAVHLPAFNRFGFSTGATFSLTLFDGQQRKTEFEKSMINLENIQFNKQQTMIQTEIQKNFTLNKLRSLDKRIQLADNQLEQYDQLLSMYKSQLGQGTLSVMDYSYLLKDISEKKQERLLFEMEKQMVINAYNYWNY
ncbi:MAG TPA: TolC family protein [Draconibacterium sp.]|nr:TolC family protein [Draconibacterium sp.]